MDRLACVDLRALPLQLLLRQHPGWSEHPAAVVEEDRPQGSILWVNTRARRRGILPGVRYAEGLSRAAGLRAAVVPGGEVAAALDEITARLRRFSPEVEPAAHEPGLFWLDASGLQRLYPSLEAWAGELVQELRDGLQLQAAVAVGFHRFGSYAVARSIPPGQVRVCADPAEEQRLARAVPLRRLALTPKLREALHRLGVETVAALVRLPASGLLERFGPEAHALHALAAGRGYAPLQPAPELPPLRERVDLDQPEPETTRLLFLIKRRLHRLLAELARRGQALARLRLTLELDPGWRPGAEAREPHQQHSLRPAQPTLDARQLSDLVRLRLESALAPRGGPPASGETSRAAREQGASEHRAERTGRYVSTERSERRSYRAAQQFRRGVTALELEAEGASATREQLQLFAQRQRRDLEAANRALARLRAELGADAVARAALRDRHLPEGRFALEPLERLAAPRPAQGERVLVRRLLAAFGATSRALPAPGGLTRALLCGPFVLSGGWWRGDEVHREYHYARTGREDLLWVYREAGRWILQGRVE